MDQQEVVPEDDDMDLDSSRQLVADADKDVDIIRSSSCDFASSVHSKPAQYILQATGAIKNQGFNKGSANKYKAEAKEEEALLLRQQDKKPEVTKENVFSKIGKMVSFSRIGSGQPSVASEL